MKWEPEGEMPVSAWIVVEGGLVRKASGGPEDGSRASWEEISRGIVPRAKLGAHSRCKVKEGGAI